MGARPFTARNPAEAAAAAAGAEDTKAPKRRKRRAGAPEAQNKAGTAPLRRGREAGALLLFTVSLFLCLALFSFRMDPQDARLEGADWVGPVGAWLASVLVRAFGLVAWLVPVELVLLGMPFVTRQPSRISGFRLAGDLVVAIVLAALMQVAFAEVFVFGRMPSGGNVGVLFGELMRALFSDVGSFLVGCTIVGLILIGRASFSFIELCQRAIELSRKLFSRSKLVRARLGTAWDAAQDIRRERQAKAKEKAAEEQPRIEVSNDEAIIAQLQTDEDDWGPLDVTGSPPLAISTTLSQRVLDLERSAAQRLVQEPAPEPAAHESPTLADAVLENAEPASGPEVSSAPGSEPAALPPEELTPTRTPPPVAEVNVAPVAAQPAVAEPSESSAPSKKTTKKPSPQSADAAVAEPEPMIVDTKPQQKVERVKAKARTREGFKLPSTELLEPPPPEIRDLDKSKVLNLADKLEKTLGDYGVTGKVEEIQPGPTVTTYELAPQAGTKVSKVAGLSDDLALGLSRKVRIIAPIPGKSRIGFELPNDERVPVNLRELVEDKRFAKLGQKAPLPIVLGRDIVGAPFYADLASMPHVIVAGATGSGKSVGLNVMLSSLLFHRSPEELRMLMIDPKVVELAPFDGIPHMLLPVVTDMKKAATALKWAVDEMERRYQLFADAHTKNITTYNRWVDRVRSGEVKPPAAASVTALDAEGNEVSVGASKEGGDGELLPDRLPYIVIVVDEFADLMMVQGKEVEAAVARLAQKARAAGMHVVLATQRPSVDVITGMIKANFPSRVAYRTAQKVDSRTILDEMGAELLLGKGDMLVKLNGSNEVRRVQCPFISEEEVEQLTDHLRSQGEPDYREEILQADEEDSKDQEDNEPSDARYDEAVRIVADTGRCSTSWLQRKMTIGYNRAAKIVEMMERQGIVGPPNGAKDREVFISTQ